MPDSKLGELLIAKGALAEKALSEALTRQQQVPQRLGALLVGDGLLEEEVLRDALAEQHGISSVDLRQETVDAAVLGLLPAELVVANEIVPLRIVGQRLHVAAVDPGNTLALDEVRFATGYTELEIHVACAADLARFVAQAYDARSPLADILEAEAVAGLHVLPAIPDRPSTESDALAPRADAIEGLANHVVAEAMRRGASQILVEPHGTSSRIRLRVDGALQTTLTSPKRLHDPLIRRLADLAGAPDADAGKIEVRLGGAQARFGLSRLKTVHGDALQLNREHDTPMELAALGLPVQATEHLARALSTPTGLYLVTGPRQSGRTTTLLAMGRAVTRPSRQSMLVTRAVVTAPAGVLVIQVRNGETAEAVLSTAIAQDPDVLLIDLPGDMSCLRLAAEAGLGGQLVVTTVDGRRALDSLGQLPAEVIPPWSVAAALRGVLAQRLVRHVCSACSQRYTPSSAEVEEFGLSAPAADRASFARGRGCAQCHGTGYQGVLLLSELAIADAGLRRAVRDGVEPGRLLGRAREGGFNTLWEDAVLRLMRGETTFEEVRTALVPG